MQVSSRHPATLIHRIRSFVALDLPEELRSQVGKVQFLLKTKYPDLVLTPEDQLHITLYFLGRQSEAEIMRLAERMKREFNFEPMTILFNRLNYIYKKGEDSIIYLEPEGDINQIEQLVRAVEPWVESLDYTAPERWLPHLTIARVKRLNPVEKKHLLFRVAGEEIPSVGPWTVSELSFWESVLTRNGVFHRRIIRVPLARETEGEKTESI